MIILLLLVVGTIFVSFMIAEGEGVVVLWTGLVLLMFASIGAIGVFAFWAFTRV